MPPRLHPTLTTIGLGAFFYGGLLILALAYVALPVLLGLYVALPLLMLGAYTIPTAFFALRAWLSNAGAVTRSAAVPAGRQRALAELATEAAPAGCEPPALFGISLAPDVWIEPSPDHPDEDTLVVGLPLLAALPRRELRALIAQQLAHRSAGGTRHVRWVEARVATLVGILDEVEPRSLVARPFELHAIAFVRMAAALSRAHVHAADAQSAAVSGEAAIAAVLRDAHRLAVAFDGYWTAWVAPVLDRGLLPPLAEGFVRCLDDPALSAWLDQVVEEIADDETADPLDPIPPLAERLPAGRLDAAPIGGAPVDLEDARFLEVELLTRLRGPDALGTLEPVTWDEVAETFADDEEEPARRAPIEPVQEGSVRITRPRRRMLAALVGLALVGLLGLPLAAICFAIPFTGGAGLAGGLFGVTMGLLLVLVLGWFAWSRTSLGLRRAYVRWHREQLTIEHPLLREPFTVRAADLRVLATCADDGAPGRFPIAADPSWELYGQGQSGWLWTKAWGSPLPILGVAPDPPNVALLFEHPVPSPRMRQQLPFGPLKGEAMAGLLFQVEDVRALDELAAAWGLRASVTDEDAEAALALWRGDEDLVAVPEA